jgi:formate dehydrogenase subunit delta
MRRAIIDHMNRGGDTGLLPLVSEARQQMQEQETTT